MRAISLILPNLILTASLFAADAASPANATTSAEVTPADSLAAGFAAPPAEARPQTWWHWMRGLVSREGITADLEAMQKIGLSGATMFNIDQLPIDDPGVTVLNPKWRELLRHATSESARLGLTLGVHNATGWSSSGGPWIRVEESMQKVVHTELTFHGPGHLANAPARPKVDPRWNYYRDIAVLAYPVKGGVLGRDGVADLTARLTPDGALNWDTPAGDWIVMRFGHTTTGQMNNPSPESGRGLECDKLSRVAVASHFAHYPAEVLKEAGAEVGHAFTRILIDSYEAGGQDWTPLFRDEFRQRRGYDPIPWLAVLAKKVVGDQASTARVERDWVKTVEELYADNYYGHFAALVHRYPGVQFAVEPYTGPFDTLEVGARADIPMAEFWTKPSPWGWETLHPVASVGHVHGKRIVAAESFTGWPTVAWQQDPYSLKATGDRAFCLGINQIVLHTTAHQPWTGDIKPGMTPGWWGTQFGRNQTWYEHGGPEWVAYLTRAQYLLQSGQFVGDILWLSHATDNPPAPAGYDGDMIGEESLIALAGVHDGQIVVPSGESYRVLVLPSPVVTPKLARKIRDLVAGGATVIGVKFERSPSLQDYPACDTEVAKIGAELWGSADGKAVFAHAYGKGRVFWGKNVADVLNAAGVGPDVKLPAGGDASEIRWIHRRAGADDIYFVSNQSERAFEIAIGFRVTGRVPELWHADTGKIEPAGRWYTAEGRTIVPLHFDPSGSVFVVFRSPAAGIDPVVSIAGEDPAAIVDARGPAPLVEAARNGVYTLKTASGKTLTARVAGLAAPFAIEGAWQLRFPPKWGAPEQITLNRLAPWNENANPGVKYFSGTAVYSQTIDVPAAWLAPGQLVYLDLGVVKNIAAVRLNGKTAGVLWKPPFRIEIGSALRPGANLIEIEVTNLWRNRLIGDEQQPPDAEWAKPEMCDFAKPPVRTGSPLAKVPAWLINGTPRPVPTRYAFATYNFFTKDTPLAASGLLGPIVIESAARVVAK